MFYCFLNNLTGQIPSGYYNGTEVLSGEALKYKLSTIIKDHTELEYDELTYALRVTDSDPDSTNNDIIIYTGWSYGKNDFENGTKEFPNRKIVDRIEKALHESFTDKRLRGEWFELNNNDVDDINKTLK